MGETNIKTLKTHLKPPLSCLWGLVAVGLKESCLCEELRDFYTDSGGFCLKTERGQHFPRALGHVTRVGPRSAREARAGTGHCACTRSRDSWGGGESEVRAEPGARHRAALARRGGAALRPQQELRAVLARAAPCAPLPGGWGGAGGAGSVTSRAER